MNIHSLLGYFLFYSFIGWIVDTSTRSLTIGRYASGSFFPAPLCPIYGFGAMLVLMIDPWISNMPLIWQWVGYGLLLAGLELMTGIIVLRLFHRRLWKYGSSVLNIAGFTDLTHAMMWGLIAILFTHVAHPFIQHFFSEDIRLLN